MKKTRKIGCVAAGAAIVGLGIAVLACILAIAALGIWNSNTETGTGIIEKKWSTSFTSESCDPEDLTDCTTTVSHSYYIRLTDGREYSLLGKGDYDAISEGDEISFEAKGAIKGLTPTIVKFEIIGKG